MSGRSVGIALVLLAALAPPLEGQQGDAPWSGYVQVRFTERRDIAGFSIRRAKLRLKGPAPVGHNLYYKVQGLFRTANRGAFTLQDVYVEYRTGLGFVRAGQMVPDFSLERNQPDAVIPLVERAAAVNVLIPSATTGARDIGVQVTLRPKAAAWHVSLGLFNGNGGNFSRNEDKRFLLTGRATYTASLGAGVSWHVGSSLAYRRTGGLAFERILGTADPFHGEDIRWGAETRLAGARWGLQSEYLWARVGERTAWGYYVLADYRVTSKFQLVASTEKLALPDPLTRGDPWYIFGFNRFVSGDRAKLMLDARVQPGDPRTNYAAVAQFQLLFN